MSFRNITRPPHFIREFHWSTLIIIPSVEVMLKTWIGWNRRSSNSWWTLGTSTVWTIRETGNNRCIIPPLQRRRGYTVLPLCVCLSLYLSVCRSVCNKNFCCIAIRETGTNRCYLCWYCQPTSICVQENFTMFASFLPWTSILLSPIRYLFNNFNRLSQNQ